LGHWRLQNVNNSVLIIGMQKIKISKCVENVLKILEYILVKYKIPLGANIPLGAEFVSFRGCGLRN